MKFNRETFFNQVRPAFGVPGIGLTSMQVDGLDTLLDFIEGDARWDAMRHETAIRTLAYFLATVAHETTIKVKIGGRSAYVMSFRPVEEMGGTAYLNRMYDTRTDLGNTKAKDGDGARYAGDGYVQNTGATNARTTGRLLAGIQIRYEDIPADKSDVLAAFAREGGSARTPVTIDERTFLREHELLRVPIVSYLDSIDGMLTGRYTGKAIGEYINDKKTDYKNARRVINRLDKADVIAGHARKFEQILLASHIPGGPADAELDPDILRKDAEIAAPETPVALDAGVQGPAGGGDDLGGAQANGAFTATIPQINTAKTWLKTMFAGTSAATVLATFLGLPLWLQITLGAMLVSIVIGAVVLFARYHKEVFTFVANMHTLAMRTGTQATLKAHNPKSK